MTPQEQNIEAQSALEQALEALEKERPYLGPMPTLTVKAITAINEALAQPAVPQGHEQEPVGKIVDCDFVGNSIARFERHLPFGTLLYTHPPVPTAQPEKHELLCVCGCTWEIDADGNEELISSPPQPKKPEQGFPKLGCVNHDCDKCKAPQRPSLRDIKPLTDQHCTWQQSDDVNMPDTWEASCGAIWTFTEGGPKDNDMHYCPKCGKPAIEKASHGITEE